MFYTEQLKSQMLTIKRNVWPLSEKLDRDMMRYDAFGVIFFGGVCSCFLFKQSSDI